MVALNEAAITPYQAIEAGHIFQWLKNGRCTELPHDPSVVGAIADNIINFCRLTQEAKKINKEKGLVASSDAENASFFADIMIKNLNFQRQKKGLELLTIETALESTIKVMETVKEGGDANINDIKIAASYINRRHVPLLPQYRSESQDDD